MFQQPQSSSNETHISFAAPAAITNMPGSVESGGGGGAVSYVAPSSGTSTSNFTMVSSVPTARGKCQTVDFGEIRKGASIIVCH